MSEYYEEPLTPEEPKTTAAKAYVAAGASAVIAFLGAVIVGLDDNVLTTAEWLTAAVAGITASGITGVATWAVPNRPKV